MPARRWSFSSLSPTPCNSSKQFVVSALPGIETLLMPSHDAVMSNPVMQELVSGLSEPMAPGRYFPRADPGSEQGRAPIGTWSAQ